MSNALPLVPYPEPPDPADLGFPDTLPLELALGDEPVSEIFQAYGLGRQDYLRLKQDPNFIQAVERAIETLKQEGASFRVKARMQAIEYLKRGWSIVHNPDTPPSVAVDMIKFTVRAAGLDESVIQKGQGVANGVNFQIVMNLGD